MDGAATTQEYLSAVEGCTKSLNLPPSVVLTTEQQVSTSQRTMFKNTMELNSSKSTINFDRPGHEHTTIPTSTPRPASTYQSLPQLAKQFGKDAGLNDAELEHLSKTVVYEARQLMEKRPRTPWKDYTYKEKHCCLRSAKEMIRVMTKKTVSRASLESMISWLINTQIHAQGEKVKGKNAAAIYIDKRNPHVLPSRSPTAPNSLSAIYSTHFDATGNTKADADKSHAKVRRFDPIRDI